MYPIKNKVENKTVGKIKNTAITKALKHSVAAVAAMSLFVLSACGSAPSASLGISNASKLNPNPHKGGTLTILTSGSNMDFDPAKSQSLPITSSSFIYRRLTTWKIQPNGKTSVIPDLATDTGTTTDGGKTWKYTLKKGLKFENGETITSKNIKYGLERSFADSLIGGTSYHKTLLKDADTYHGPFEGKSLYSIETPDDSTIIFHLTTPFADWPWVTSMAAFVPIPTNAGPTAKDVAHVASGPYRVEKYEAGKQLVMVRNKYWDKKTDPMRTAGPDKIFWKLGSEASVAAQSIIHNSKDTKNAFLSSFVPPSQLAQAQASPSARKLLVTSKDGALEYLAINTQRVTDLNLRKAIYYAVDKQSYRTAKGGAIAGNFANDLITPGIQARASYDLYHVGPRGDVNKSKEYLKKSGKESVKLTLLATPDQAAIASSIQNALKRAGIKVTIKTLDDEVYTDATTGNSGDYDLALSSWQPDFPSPYANINPLFHSSQIGNGNYNLARYKNEQVDNDIIKATQTIDEKAAAKLWQKVDKEIMKDAPIVPLIYSHNTFIHGENVENFFIGSFPAYPNYSLVSLGK